MDLIKDVGINVCQNCGVINGYDAAPKNIDFYENKKRKEKVIQRGFSL